MATAFLLKGFMVRAVWAFSVTIGDFFHECLITAIFKVFNDINKGLELRNFIIPQLKP